MKLTFHKLFNVEMMMKGKIYLPTRKSKGRVLILFILISIIYLIDTPPVAASMDSFLFNYVLKPALWLEIAFFVWSLPRIHHKSKLRYNNFLRWWALNFAIIYIGVYAVAGFIDGFGRSPYSHSTKGILLNILMVGTATIGRELVRGYAVNSLTKEENYIVFIFVALFMAVTNISLISFLNFKSIKDVVIFAAQTFAPEFGKSLFATYLAFLGGPAPSMIYVGVIDAFNWFSPILPDLKWITSAVVGILCPVFSFISLQNMYIKESKQVKLRNNEEENLAGWMATIVLSIGITWFSIGVFPIFPSVVATGSMEPLIKPGDVILVNKNIDRTKLKRGDIIQFKRDNILISHRIIEELEVDGGRAYRTKGDNNSVADSELVKPNDIKGVIVKVVPKIGWPTLLLKSRNDVPLEKVEF